MDVADLVASLHRLLCVNRSRHIADDLIIQRLIPHPVVPWLDPLAGLRPRRIRITDDGPQINRGGFGVLGNVFPLEQIHAADDVIQASRAHRSEQLPHFVRD